jgi:hypothetical protein
MGCVYSVADRNPGRSKNVYAVPEAAADLVSCKEGVRSGLHRRWLAALSASSSPQRPAAADRQLVDQESDQTLDENQQPAVESTLQQQPSEEPPSPPVKPAAVDKGNFEFVHLRDQTQVKLPGYV